MFNGEVQKFDVGVVLVLVFILVCGGRECDDHLRSMPQITGHINKYTAATLHHRPDTRHRYTCSLTPLPPHTGQRTVGTHMSDNINGELRIPEGSTVLHVIPHGKIIINLIYKEH